MAKVTRSAIFGMKEETTEGTLIALVAGSEFLPLRSGYTFDSNVETLSSDEIQNDIGKTKGAIGKETPTMTFPNYLKHSGIEGTAPETSLAIESAMGTRNVKSIERDVVSAAAGTSSAAATITVDTGEGSEFFAGMALLIKDNLNNYTVRNIRSIAGDVLTLAHNLSNAPAAGVNLGLPIHYSPASTGHKRFSGHLFQAETSSAYHQAMAGMSTTAINIEFPASDYAVMDFEFAGIEFFFNPIEITSSNFSMDFSDGVQRNASITQKVYKTPIELGREIEVKMNALTADAITVSYSSTTGNFTLSSDGGTFSLLWNTGTNTATAIGTALGFSVAADDTGSSSYVSDSAISFDPGLVPVFDDSEKIVVKGNELILGNFGEFLCKSATTAAFAIATPKTDIDDICDANGIESSVTMDREVTFTATLILKQFEVGLFDKFINNTTTTLAFNAGPKSSDNWIGGKCFNIYFANATITSHIVADNEGYQVVNIEAKAHVTGTQKDVHLNWV